MRLNELDESYFFTMLDLVHQLHIKVTHTSEAQRIELLLLIKGKLFQSHNEADELNPLLT